MCTAITYQTKDHYFGRNLDFEYDYGETVTITPRNYPLRFRRLAPMENHYAMIGMAKITNNYPLYFDATNEYGLSAAGLNFPVSARYLPEVPEKDNIAPYELIPWLLGNCKSVAEAIQKLHNVNIVNLPFSKELPLTPLHWILADRLQTITIEPMEHGIVVHQNPVGVLTNEPPFPFHIMNLSNYMHVTREEAVNRFSDVLPLTAYSRGMGSIGLPGDLSSASRFVRATFTKMNSVSKDAESTSISQVFHILGSVTQQQGCVQAGHLYEKTIYTSCCNTTKGIYYYTTYENSQITGVCLHGEDLESEKIISYPLISAQQIRMEN